MTFEEFGLSEDVMRGLAAMNFKEATPVQEQTIPVILQKRDLIACAQTGTGKTAAYILPLLNLLTEKQGDGDRVRAVIVAPTRELAQQIDMQFEGFSYFLPISTVVVSGGGDGASWDQQKRGLTMGADIIIATPGRLISHLNISNIDFSGVECFILDEADRMLDMGFFDDVTKIIEKVKNRRNLGLFSATISQEVMTVSWMYQRDEVEITVPADTDNRPDITQYSITCPPLEKIDMVSRLIRTLRLERTIVFCNTKVMCQRLRDDLVRMGLDADCIHGDIPQQKREKTMRTFKDGKLPILIATDVASRGIDVDDVDCVINYDVPEENEYYIHRIGRTGRAKKKGIAVSILGTFPEQAKLAEIAKYSHYVVQPVKFAEDGALVEEEPPKPRKAPPRRRFR